MEVESSCLEARFLLDRLNGGGGDVGVGSLTALALVVRFILGSLGKV